MLNDGLPEVDYEVGLTWHVAHVPALIGHHHRESGGKQQYLPQHRHQNCLSEAGHLSAHAPAKFNSKIT